MCGPGPAVVSEASASCSPAGRQHAGSVWRGLQLCQPQQNALCFPRQQASLRPCRQTLRCFAHPQANQGEHAGVPLGRLCPRVGRAHHLLHAPLQEGGQPRLVILLQIQLLLEDHLQKGRSSALGCHLQRGREGALCCSLGTMERRAGSSVVQQGEQGNSFCADSRPLAAIRLLLTDHLKGARHEVLCDGRQEQQQGRAAPSIWKHQLLPHGHLWGCRRLVCRSFKCTAQQVQPVWEDRSHLQRTHRRAHSISHRIKLEGAHGAQGDSLQAPIVAVDVEHEAVLPLGLPLRQGSGHRGPWLQDAEVVGRRLQARGRLLLGAVSWPRPNGAFRIEVGVSQAAGR